MTDELVTRLRDMGIQCCDLAAARIEQDAAKIARLESSLQSATAPHTDRITMGRAAMAGRVMMLEATIARLEKERDEALAKLARAREGVRQIAERQFVRTQSYERSASFFAEAVNELRTAAHALLNELDGGE